MKKKIIVQVYIVFGLFEYITIFIIVVNIFFTHIFVFVSRVSYQKCDVIKFGLRKVW